MARSKSVVRLHTTIDLGAVMNLSSPLMPEHDPIIDAIQEDDSPLRAAPIGPVDPTWWPEPR